MTDRQKGQGVIRDACRNIGLELMKIHPAVPLLGDKETQDGLYQTLFELTREVETIKKALIRLEKRDASTEL
jgi:hypothetical protein